MPYTESSQFLRNYKRYDQSQDIKIQNKEQRLLEYVLQNSEAKNPSSVIKAIDTFAQKYWMMNLGEDKSQIVKEALKAYNPSTILQLGGYCGYSALVMAHHSKAVVHTIEISDKYASIAHKIHQHAGLANRIIIHIGTATHQSKFISQHGAFGLIFIDHVKNLYLADLKLLESLGAVKKGTVVVGDNIIYPGAPEYLKYFKESQNYESTLYHSYLEYSEHSDAVLVSVRLTN